MKRLGIVGAGYMAENHARVAVESGRAELHVVIDIDSRRARSLAARHGARWSCDLSAAGELDVAIVATTTDAHAGCALPLLAAGIATMVEKPLGPDIASAAAIVHAAQRSGAVLTCGFVERFNPIVIAARAQIEDEPIHFHAVRHSPSAPRIQTSVIHDLLIHDADLAVQFATGPVGTVTSSSWTAPGTGAVELADAVVNFQSGMIANLSASRVGQRKVREIRLTTPSAVVELDLLRQDITVYRNLRQEQNVGETINYREQTTIDIPFVRHNGEPLALQFRHLLELVDGEHDPEDELRSLIAAHEIVEAVASVDGPSKPLLVDG